jgi:hypothetical protein
MLHSQHLNFFLVSLFLAEQIGYRILLHYISQCLLCLVSSLVSWVIDGARLPCLAVKMLIRQGSFLMWDGSVCCNPWEPL